MRWRAWVTPAGRKSNTVIAMLSPLGVDLVELSGAGYESPALTGQSGDDRTRAREAYFLTLAEELVQTSTVPLMLTGGVARRPVAEEVLSSGVDLVGMGSASSSTRTCRPGGDPTRTPK